MVLRTLAFLAASLVLLASCSDEDPEPILAPSSSAEPTSAEPSPTSSSKPETAEEFIERWVKMSNQMQNTGDTEAYLAISRQCAPCRGVAEDVTDIFGAGGFVQTAGWDVLEVVSESGSAKAPTIDVRIRSAPVSVRRTADAAVETLPGGRLVERFELARNDSEWSLLNLSQVAS